MSEELLKKKSLIEKEPIFNHSEGEIEAAIGVKGIVESIAQKLNALEHQTHIVNPSRAVEFLYNSLTKVELAFLVMHSMSKQVDTDLTQPEEEN